MVMALGAGEREGTVDTKGDAKVVKGHANVKVVKGVQAKVPKKERTGYSHSYRTRAEMLTSHWHSTVN